MNTVLCSGLHRMTLIRFIRILFIPTIIRLWPINDIILTNMIQKQWAIGMTMTTTTVREHCRMQWTGVATEALCSNCEHFIWIIITWVARHRHRHKHKHSHYSRLPLTLSPACCCCCWKRCSGRKASTIVYTISQTIENMYRSNEGEEKKSK